MGRITLVATDGMIYTDGKTYGTLVELAVGENPDNWWEITEAEYEAIMAEETAEDIATVADYQEALREMGVKV